MPNSRKNRKWAKQFRQITKQVIPGNHFLRLIKDSWARIPYAPYAGLGYMYYDPCVYCGNPSDGWDHLTAQAVERGLHFNQARSCRKCNSTKGIKTPLEFLVWRARKVLYCKHDAERTSCRICIGTQRYQAARQRLRFRRGR